MAALLRIVVCDDHERVRAGLRRLLEIEPGLKVVGEASDAKGALEQSRRTQPDILLLDIVMPGRSGIDVLPDVIAAAPATRILMLSMQDDPLYVQEALAAGASGYLLKEAADSHLVEAIRSVADGGHSVHPVVAAARRPYREPAAAGSHAGELTQREHAVLRGLAQGRTNQEIASHLSISVDAAERDRAEISLKLGLKTRAEIMRYVLRAATPKVGERPAS